MTIDENLKLLTETVRALAEAGSRPMDGPCTLDERMVLHRFLDRLATDKADAERAGKVCTEKGEPMANDTDTSLLRRIVEQNDESLALVRESMRFVREQREQAKIPFRDEWPNAPMKAEPPTHTTYYRYGDVSVAQPNYNHPLQEVPDVAPATEAFPVCTADEPCAKCVAPSAPDATEELAKKPWLRWYPREDEAVAKMAYELRAQWNHSESGPDGDWPGLARHVLAKIEEAMNDGYQEACRVNAEGLPEIRKAYAAELAKLQRMHSAELAELQGTHVKELNTQKTLRGNQERRHLEELARQREEHAKELTREIAIAKHEALTELAMHIRQTKHHTYELGEFLERQITNAQLGTSAKGGGA